VRALLGSSNLLGGFGPDCLDLLLRGVGALTVLLDVLDRKQPAFAKYSK
jgi:hypothetical protein